MSMIRRLKSSSTFLVVFFLGLLACKKQGETSVQANSIFFGNYHGRYVKVVTPSFSGYPADTTIDTASLSVSALGIDSFGVGVIFYSNGHFKNDTGSKFESWSDYGRIHLTCTFFATDSIYYRYFYGSTGGRIETIFLGEKDAMNPKVGLRSCVRRK